MNYFIEDEQNNKILLADEDLNRLNATLDFMPELKDYEIKSTNKDIVLVDNEFRFKDDVEDKLTAIEQERINNLTMTALDFITFLQQAGLTLQQINGYLEANLDVKMQLTYCQNVYCGVVKQLMPITVGDITITSEMVEIAFRIKNGEEIEE